MARLALVPLLAFAALSVVAAPNSAPVNLDFESGAPGQVPPGWFAPTSRAGWAAAIATESPKQGKQCVKLSGKPQAMQSGRPSFGNVMQEIDATPYRGKRVRLRGAVRVQGMGARAGLWMRVDRTGGAFGFFDNMSDRFIRSADWAYYEISGDVAGDAQVLNIGLMLVDEGNAWLDDVTLEVVSKQAMRGAAPRAVTTRGLDNLVAFTRLFGIVRHFHPTDEAVAADWDAIAVNGAEAVEGAKDATELAAKLEQLFLPLAPTLRVYSSTATPPPPPAKPANAQVIIAWEHYGLGGKDARSIYRSDRKRIELTAADKRFPHPLQPLRLDLGGGVSASVPLAVFADATRTLPAPTHKASAPSAAAAYSGNDRSTRLGAVVILWNVLQHFYPYFDVVDVDWPAELRTALRAAGTDRDELAFYGTLRRMIASIDDGHGSVSHQAATARPAMPILWRAIGDALVVTAVDGVAGVKVADEVIAIDGKPAVQALREAEELVSGATPQWRRLMALRDLTIGTASSATLTIRNAGGSTRTVKVPRSVRMEQPLREKRPDPVTELKPGIWYVDLARLTDNDFTASVNKLAGARGIVFDLRGYPRVGTTPLRHLIGSRAESARWNVPVARRPDLAGAEWDGRGRWTLEPLRPRFTGKIVFLTDGRAISYAESWMGIVEAYKLGTIVGETTAGTNGNINIVDLPGGYRAIFTGMKVLKHDGSRHHGVGIAPNVAVSPTLAGIRAGRDEQLEKALEIVGKP